MTQMRIRRVLAFYAAVWIIASISLFPLATGASGATNGDVEQGRQLFEKRCSGCHSLDKNKEGPRLQGVYGRKAGSVPDFSYSDPLKAANLVWDEHSLDRWLTNPDAVVPDNDMAFHVANAEERDKIIQFLKLSSGK